MREGQFVMLKEMVLKEALLEMQEYLVMQYPEPTEEDNKLPFKFRKKMKRLLKRCEHPIWC